MTSQVGNNSFRRGLHGLTLIELMAVMAIMIIIVSAIVVAAYAVQRQGQIKATGGLLQQLSLALETYRAQHRMYVPREHDPVGTVPITDPAQVEKSSEVLWTALEYVDKIPTNVKDSNKHAAGSMQAPDTGEFMTKYYYQDAWRQAIIYECNNPPFTRFMLLSTGPDLEFGTSDDILEGEDLTK